MKLNFQRQAGATLIEIIMVVALIAIITIGALVYYNSAQNGSRVSEAVSGVTALSAVVRNQFSTQGNYNGVTEGLVMRFGGVPESLVVRNGANPVNLKHPWNNAAGSVTVDPATTTAPDDSFRITFTQVPANICNDLLSKTYRHFLRTDVGTTAVASVAAITNACGSAGNVSVSFTQR
jgi:type II secretory pathway pseudopilin PulG